MSIQEAAVEIRNQSPILFHAYLWAAFYFVVLCAAMGIFELVKRKD